MTEASLAGKLMHPHIVQIFDAVVAEEQSYIVMEYVKGGTLEPFCTPSSLLPVDRLVEMIFKCTRALDYAFRAGSHPPRHQAGEHPARGSERQPRAQQRRHQDLRLRRGDDEQRRTDPHPGLWRRLTGLHVAAAGARHAAQPPDRHLLAGRGDVPVADRAAAVPVEFQLRHDLPDLQRRSAAALDLAHRHARRPRCRGRARHAEGGRRPLPELGGVLPRPRAVLPQQAARPSARPSPTARSSRRCARCPSLSNSPTYIFGKWCASRAGTKWPRAR
jgi:hypothetical protein